MEKLYEPEPGRDPIAEVQLFFMQMNGRKNK